MPEVGEELHGFCDGLFGRDHYGTCVVEAVGPDWIVVRNSDGSAEFASDDTREGGWKVAELLQSSNSLSPGAA